MNGATTEPCAKINKPPNTNITIIIGAKRPLEKTSANNNLSIAHPAKPLVKKTIKTSAKPPIFNRI